MASPSETFNFLRNLLGSDEAQAEFEAGPQAFLNEQGVGDITVADIQQVAPAIFSSAQGFQGSVDQGGSADFSDSGNVDVENFAATGGGSELFSLGGNSSPIEAITQFTEVFNQNFQTFEDNDVTNISDNDVDNSVNSNIVAAGDVEFDQAVASGAGSTAASGEAQINSGDGAVLAGDDISDATIATGDVGGSVTGDNTDSLVGDDNQAILNSEVGAAAFGGGDATNVDAGGGNVNFGSGTQIADNQGDVQNAGGDLANVENSSLSESVVGSGSVESNDTSIDIDASEGSGVAFGAGSTASGEDQDVDVDNSGDGVVQVAGDDATQDAAVDNSEVDIDNSDNSDNSLDATDSFNDNSDNSDDDLVDIDNQPQDNDVVDIDG